MAQELAKIGSSRHTGYCTVQLLEDGNRTYMLQIACSNDGGAMLKSFDCLQCFGSYAVHVYCCQSNRPGFILRSPSRLKWEGKLGACYIP